MTKVRRFLAEEEGPTSIEYALMLALIVIVAIAGLRFFRIFLTAKMNQLAKPLSS